MSESEFEKRKCFVALFDILGFENLINRSKNLLRLADAYKKMRTDVIEMKGHINGVMNMGQKQKRNSIIFNSYADTLLIYSADLTSETQSEKNMLFLAMLAACDAIFLAANEYKLPIRGAMSKGELIISKGILIGKPIIKAYKAERKQDWIGCWIKNECISEISNLNEHLSAKSLIRYKIPLKVDPDEIECPQSTLKGQKRRINYIAFNWLQSFFLKGEKNLKINFLKTNSKNPKIRRKVENTAEFVKFVRKQSKIQSKI